MQEALTPGDLMSLVLKERLEVFLTRVRQNLEKAAKKRGSSFTLTTIEFQVKHHHVIYFNLKLYCSVLSALCQTS